MQQEGKFMVKGLKSQFVLVVGDQHVLRVAIMVEHHLMCLTTET